jgi:hypothetical protein
MSRDSASGPEMVHLNEHDRHDESVFTFGRWIMVLR